MKRLLLTMIFLCIGVVTFAQEGFGVLGGLTSSSNKIKEFDFNNVTQYRAGIAYKYPVAIGFAVQPEFSYSVKGTTLVSTKPNLELLQDLDICWMNLHMGYLEAALQLQWGPDLLLFRPYALVEPFVGYALNNKVENPLINTPYRSNVWDSVQRLEYGYAFGGGLELFGRLQLSAKRYKNLGSIYKEPERGRAESFDDLYMKAFKGDNNFGGWVLTLTFFFY